MSQNDLGDFLSLTQVWHNADSMQYSVRIELHTHLEMILLDKLANHYTAWKCLNYFSLDMAQGRMRRAPSQDRTH